MSLKLINFQFIRGWLALIIPIGKLPMVDRARIGTKDFEDLSEINLGGVSSSKTRATN